MDLENLYKELAPKLHRFACNFLYHNEDAEDIVQEVFIEFYQRKLSFKDFNRVKSYLFKAVYNRCLNKIRALKIRDDHQKWLLEAQINADSLDVGINEELISKVKEAVGQLPERCREVFFQAIVLNHKYSEISEDMGISPLTVKTHMQRAYKYLRKELGAVPVYIIYIVLSEL